MAPEDILYMLQECNPYLPSKDRKDVKVEENEGDVNQAVLVLKKESVTPIESAREVLNFGFSAISRYTRATPPPLEALPATQPSRCLLRSWSRRHCGGGWLISLLYVSLTHRLTDSTTH